MEIFWNIVQFQINAALLKFPPKYGAAQLFSTLIIIRNVSNQHIRMISKGSCETED